MKTIPVDNINSIVSFERVPSDYVRLVPFHAVIHCAPDDLTLAERELVKSAIANVGTEIQRRRMKDPTEAFCTLYPSENP